MKKTTKTFAILAALAVFGTSGLFAQNVIKESTAVQIPAEYKDAKTVAVSIKVNKKDQTDIKVKLNNGKVYLAESFGPEGDKAIDYLSKHNGRKAILSGFVNDQTGVFSIIKIGSLYPTNGGDEK